MGVGAGAANWRHLARLAERSVRRCARSIRLPRNLPVVPCGQSDVLPGEANLLRRVKDHPSHVIWDDNDHRWRLLVEDTSNALQFDVEATGKREWSTYWRQHLEGRHGAGPSAVLKDGYTLVFQVSAGDVRQIEYQSVRFTVDHSPDDDTPVDCAHCSVAFAGQTTKAIRKTLRELLADKLQLVWGDPSGERPTGA